MQEETKDEKNREKPYLALVFGALLLAGIALGIFYFNRDQDQSPQESKTDTYEDNKDAQGMVEEGSTITEESRQLGLFAGYYTTFEQNIWDSDSTRLCHALVVTDGDRELTQYFIDMVVEGGNTVQHIDSEGRLVLNLPWDSIPQVDKERIQASSEDSQITLSLRKKIPRGTEAPACYSFFDYVGMIDPDNINSRIDDSSVIPNTDKLLLDDLKSLRGDLEISLGTTQYAAYMKARPRNSDRYSPFGEEGGSFYIGEDLIILDLETGERRVININDQLVSEKMISVLKNVPSGTNYSIHPELIRWSPFNSSILWGKLSLYSPADPPMAQEISFFEIDLVDSTVNKLYLPSHGLFGKIEASLRGRVALYESIGNGLALHLYNWETGEDTVIVSYSKEIFEQYCRHAIEYVYAGSIYGDCGKSRQLDPAWAPDGISYLDFITREEVIVDN